MEPHRAPLLPPRPSAPPPIPPSSNPSLSTGQAFYTVESLQGATVVPPPQLLPPEPLHFAPQLLPNDRAFVPHPMAHPPHLERGHPLMGRKPLPSPQLPPPNFVQGMRGGGPGMGPHPHFMMDPRIAGYHPGREALRGRERDLRRGFLASRNADRNRMDRGRIMPRFRVKKQGQKAKSVPDSKVASSAATMDEKSPAGESKPTEGGPGWCSVCQIDCFRAKTLKKHLAGKKHKRQLEIVNGLVDEPKGLDEEDEGMKDEEIADDTNIAAMETVNEETIEGAKEEKENEHSDTAEASKAATIVAGKKRASEEKDSTSATRKRSKPTAVTDAQIDQVTAADEGQNNENSRTAEKVASVVEVCELCNVTCSSKAVLEIHLKGKKHAARMKKGANTPKEKPGVDEGKEPAATGEMEPSEAVKGAEEGANVTGEPSNGIIGQTAQSE